jgi:hypothetical protein
LVGAKIDFLRFVGRTACGVLRFEPHTADWIFHFTHTTLLLNLQM